MSKQVAPARRGPAATIIWVLMIFGIVFASTLAGKMLHPFSLPLLVAVTAKIAAGAFVIACIAVWGVETTQGVPGENPAAQTRFIEALREVWAEPQARRFAIFVFLSMLAYSAQELVLEPFAGAVFALSPAAWRRDGGHVPGGVRQLFRRGRPRTGHADMDGGRLRGLGRRPAGIGFRRRGRPFLAAESKRGRDGRS
jgi:BCD family chlorophyll transporter-like MFS transporter